MGTGVVSAYKVLARYADLVQLRWDEDCCWVHSLFARFLLESRKNRQYESCYLDVARPFNSTRRGRLRPSPVLPRISSRNAVDTSRPMGYGKYVRHQRVALTELGVDPAVARTCAGQSPRAGAAGAAARAGAFPGVIANAAGVMRIDRPLTYNWADIGDRLLASWALGF